MAKIEKSDERNASITVKLRADSGYSVEQTERITANQWGRICAILAENPDAT